MAQFGAYSNSSSPRMKWYADYSVSRTSNTELTVTLTVYGEIINHAASSYMGTGNAIVVTGTVGGQSQTYEIKSSSASWKGNTSNPRSCTFTFRVASSTAGETIDVSYKVAGSGYTAPATVPTQSTSFSSPALLYTASTVSASADGNAIAVTISRQHGDMTHTVTYSYGSSTASHTGCTASDSFTVPAGWITDNAGGYINVTCETYLGGAYIGSASTRVWVTVPAGIVPSITSTACAVVDAKLGVALAGHSKIQWSAAAAGADGSWITASAVSGGGYTVPLTGLTGVIYDSGDIDFTITATDSRGRSCSVVKTVSVTPYTRPSVTVTAAQRCLADGTLDEDGTYLRCEGTATYDPVGGKNSVTYQLWYRKLGETDWSDTYAWTPGTATIIGDGEVNPDDTYEVWFQAKDAVPETSYYIITVHAKRYLLDLYEDDNGVQSVGIGGAAKEDGKTTVYNPLTCLEPAQLAGGQWVHRAWGTSGSTTYVKFAELTVTGGYPNMGISLDIIQRGIVYPSRLSAMFDGSTADTATLAAFEVYGWKTNYWIKKESTSTWGLYAYKVEAYDEIDIVGFMLPPYPGIQVTWVDEAVSSLDGATAATISNMHVVADDIQAEFAHAGTLDATSIEALMPVNPTFLGTATLNGQWYNVISTRHRNNKSDGIYYGLAMLAPLFGGDLEWLQQTAEGTFSAHRKILDSGNTYGDFGRRGDGSAGGYIKINDYQACWGWLYFSIAVSTATGNNYYGIWEGTHNYARGFADTPAVTLTVESDLIKSVSLIGANATGISKVQLFDSRSRSAQGWYVHYIAVGKAG